MADTSHKRLQRVTIIYLTLLFYIVAALVWWFISLEKQNHQMAQQRLADLDARTELKGTASYPQLFQLIRKEEKRNSAKYISEGITFFILIMIGAGFVFTAIRRQFKLQQQQQNFMMAVTHELKTPISVARLNLETMQKYALDPEKQKKLIRMTLEETSRLNFLTSNILISSQLEGGGYKNSKEELDFSDLLKDCMNGFRARFPDRKFNDKIETNVDLLGDPLLLQMLINNLVENAIKYSPKDSVITAALNKQSRQVILQVIDEGTGIADEEKKKIFSKFYRVGNETTRKTQGTGLGLYLCNIIARDHNADISVTDNTPNGSKFAVIFKV